MDLPYCWYEYLIMAHGLANIANMIILKHFHVRCHLKRKKTQHILLKVNLTKKNKDSRRSWKKKWLK